MQAPSRLLRSLGLALLRGAHRLQLARLRLDLRRAAWRTQEGRPLRVAVAACWKFPIYSQTFVQQEVMAMAQGGFRVRFLYAQAGERSELAHTCAALWSLRHRLVMHPETARADLAHYRRRMPDRVEALTLQLAQAAGMRPEELLAHEHFLFAFSFARAVEAWGADYLHSYFFYEQSFFALVASQLLDIPRGVSCYADHLLADYPLKLVPLHLRTCQVIVATSRRIRAELEAMHGAVLETALVKPNAIDTTSFDPGVRGKRAGEAPLRLLCVSRIDPKKGVEYLLDAARLLRDAGRVVEVRIVGAADANSPDSVAYEAALRQRLVTLGLGEAVHFAGRCDSREVRQYLRQADVFVAPFVELENGDKDGIPTAVLEAMAAGCSIVASDAGSIAEILRDGRDGLLVPQRNAAALAAALERVHGDPDLARRLGESAAARARAEFDVGTAERVFHERMRAAAVRVPGRAR